MTGSEMVGHAPHSASKTGTETIRPLDGLRVLDCVGGEMAAISRLLAELGADVIRLEPAAGAADRRAGIMIGPVSLDFIAANLGKRAATDDQFGRLVAGADIVIVPPGYTNTEDLSRAYPSLVIVSVSDFGMIGRFASWHGSDAVFHALSGELSRSGLPDRPPLLLPGTLSPACAAVQGTYVALIAYWRALITGQGDHLDFSVLDGAAHALDPGYGIAGSASAGVPASKLPRGRTEARFRYPIVACKDGFVRLCILAPRQWQAMYDWMGAPAAFSDPSFAQIQTRFASKELLPAITAFFADKTRGQIEEQGRIRGVPAAAVLDLNEALNSDQIIARGAFRNVEVGPGLSAPFPDGVIDIDGVRMGFTSGVPQLSDGNIEWRSPRIPAPAPRPSHRPLDGLRVLDLGVIVVGAETGRLLADQGADVIKIESTAFPDGSRQNGGTGPIGMTFATGHRNKRSLGINLRDPRGKALFLDLVRNADVVLSNFKGGTLASLGLDYASLKSINPAVIVTDSSAFGPSGPWSTRMGYGPLVRASAGLTMQWRYDGDDDSFSDAITVYPDHVAGRIGAIGVIALLVRRLRTARGGQVGVSQIELMLSHLAAPIAADVLARDGHEPADERPCSQLYPCAGDDDWLVVTVRDGTDERAIEQLTCDRPLAKWLEARPSRDAMESLQAAGVPAGAMLRVSELPEFDYFAARGFFREVRHPFIDEPFLTDAAPVLSAELPAPPERPAPLLGEHTIEIARTRLNLPDATIADLIRENVIEQASEIEGFSA